MLESGPLPAAASQHVAARSVAPVMLDGRLLVDGGAVNPVPFDRLPADCTVRVAVDVIGQCEHVDGKPPSLSESIFNTFRSWRRASFARSCSPRGRTFTWRSTSAACGCSSSSSAADLHQAERAKEQLKQALVRRLGLA